MTVCRNTRPGLEERLRRARHKPMRCSGPRILSCAARPKSSCRCYGNDPSRSIMRGHRPWQSRITNAR
jgi:hypothetical protein